MNKRTLASFFFAALCGLSTAWGATEAPPVAKAQAKILPAKGSEVTGTVTFIQVNGGVEIIADFKGLKPGRHGFHIHEHGDCSAPDFSSAGGHYNPYHKKHGGPDSLERHVGDLGNVKALEDGTAHYDRIDSVIELNGNTSIIGRAVIIHSDPDDYTSQPAGNAGSRIGCGVIEPVKE